eukprot:scaffold65308_cov63-Phaeocystis_antarctica.AAC.3
MCLIPRRVGKFGSNTSTATYYMPNHMPQGRPGPGRVTAGPGRTIVFLGGARAPTLDTVWGLDGEGK